MLPDCQKHFYQKSKLFLTYLLFLFDNMKIKFNSPLRKPLCLDGESLDDMDGEYEIKIDKDVHVLMPSKNIDSLFIKDK